MFRRFFVLPDRASSGKLAGFPQKMRPLDDSDAGSPPPRSYGGWMAWVQSFLRVALVLACAAPMAARAAAERPVRVVALGDSLTAGLGLPADAAFPVKLEKAL